MGELRLWDTVSIIIGIVVGVSIFKAPPLIFSNVATPWHGFAAWLLGGALVMLGAFCYAELASRYPASGGDYAYLTRAFGSWAGFLFGWAQLVAVFTGSIAIMAYVFGDYAVRLFNVSTGNAGSYAALVIVVLTVLNCAGLTFGKTTQNVLTVAKIFGLAGLVLAGLALGTGGNPNATTTASENPSFGIAMVLILYTFGGWNDAVFVTAEVRDPRRNVPRALLIGITLIVTLYMLVNLAYLNALGFDGLRQSKAPAADALLQVGLGDWASRTMSLLVMVSAMGAINGMLLTGSRIFAALGRDHAIFSRLGRWSVRRGAPINALAVQAIVAIMMILLVDTLTGRTILDWCYQRLAMVPPDWNDFDGGFDKLVAGTAPIFWLFFLLTGISVFVLRGAATEHRYCMPLYPWPAILFCAMCGYMLWSSINYAGKITLIWVVPLLLGVPLYFFNRRAARGDS